MMVWWAWIIVMCAASTAANAQLYVRGSEAPLAAPIERVEREGVVLSDASGTLVPWYDVKAVLGEHADEAEAYLDFATDAWRAMTRLERGDHQAAAPLFAELFEDHNDGTGPMSAMIARGHLACLIHDRQYADALAPFLVSVSASEVDRPARPSVPIDPAFGLAPAIPPFWFSIETPIVPLPVDSLGSSMFVSAYALAAADPDPVDAPDELVIEHDPRDAAQRLVAQIVLARLGSGPQREAARGELRTIAGETTGAWIEAWCRIGIARSLVRESDESARELAVVELLHVPSRIEPRGRLAELAIGFAIQTLAESGQADTARRLLDLLKNEHNPTERTLDWLEELIAEAESRETPPDEDPAP